MRRIPGPSSEPLFLASATRLIEHDAAAALPAHTLMARAGTAVAELALALAPHARHVWVACGPGNNGGDGLMAASRLHQWHRTRHTGTQITVTFCGEPDRLPDDAANAWQQLQAAGLAVSEHPPEEFDLAIDALLGIGARRRPEGRLAEHLQQLRQTSATVLCVDVPSQLDGDTGAAWSNGGLPRTPPGPRHTLSLLTPKPGLFTADGRDAAGTVWFDELGIQPPTATPDARLFVPEHATPTRPHATHKGRQGDVIVLGGQHIDFNGVSMVGAALLAGRAALHAGAGRVFVGLLADTQHPIAWDPANPELMLRQPDTLLDPTLLAHACVVCGCGGGEAVEAVLPGLLEHAPRLVLDADALNRIAESPALGRQLKQRRQRDAVTVMTPHPLEAARLLGSSTTQIMGNRLQAARTLSETWGAVCVLKGSGTVSATPRLPPLINASGDPALATAGTGDVLAGLIGAALAAIPDNLDDETLLTTVATAVHRHGLHAEQWSQNHPGRPMVAGWLAAQG